MEEKNEWVPFQEIEWDDEKFNVFSVDTRDFHCGYRFEKKPHKDFSTIKNYPHFFHTQEEIVELITRYYNETGGAKNWRFLYIPSMDNWNLKYIRIWRTELGFVVCDCENRALKKSLLAETALTCNG